MGSTGVKPYVIIGCPPRGGTVFMQTALREIGLEVGHEDPDNDGVVGWQHLCTNHPWTLKALRKGRRRPKVYLMQFRHPVPTINRIAAMYFRKEWPPRRGVLDVQYMCRMEVNDTPVMRAMRLYYHLNALGMKDRKFKLRYQIESMDEDWPRIMGAIGMPGTPMPDIPRDTNTHKDKGKYPNLDWPDIAEAFPLYAGHIERLATCMGYEVADTTYTELFKWAEEQKGES